MLLRIVYGVESHMLVTCLLLSLLFVIKMLLIYKLVLISKMNKLCHCGNNFYFRIAVENGVTR